jgi:GNAT superfamily N-acetyltransferase
MEALLEQARRDGVERLSLSVEAGSAQEQFYAKFGFERVRDGVMVATLAADVPKA